MRIKNADKFQSFDGKRPKWIKLHVSLLSNPEFIELDVRDKWNLISLWLHSVVTQNWPSVGTVPELCRFWVSSEKRVLATLQRLSHFICAENEPLEIEIEKERTPIPPLQGVTK